ncbi:hypothetical protein TWF281_007631 [Arthrobotrys megalospora]
MDPLSISASIAGLIALTTGLIKLTDTIRSSFKEDVLQLVTGVSQDIELLHGIVLRIQTWADSVQSTQKYHHQLVNLSPFVSNCTDIIKRIGGQLLALKEVAKKRGFKKIYSVVNLNERMKELDASRIALGEAKTTLLLALSTKDQDISASLDVIQTKLENIYQSVSNPSPSGTEPTTTEFDGPQSFEEWLKTFTAETSAGELSEYRLRKQKERQLQREAAGQKSLQTADPNKIYIKVVDMKNKNGEIVTETLFLDRSENLIDIILQLHEQGYEDVCGFRTEDRNHEYGPFEGFTAPPLVRVTAGPSSYNLRTGLKINEDERLIDYFNDALDYQTSRDPDGHPSYSAVRRRELSQGLEIVDLHDHQFSKVQLNFMRCQRVPADGEIHNPPEAFGSFPLLAVSDFKNKLPATMAKKGGFFFPMLQREGLGLKFTASTGCDDEVFAVRLHAGSVNVVSGEPVSKQENEAQDYVVAPRQQRLDGVKVELGKVQQFVAMPLTWGYTVEKQVTESEFIGGIQLQIAPKLKDSVYFCSDPQRHGSRDHSDDCKLDIYKSPRELGLTTCFMDIWHDSGYQLKCDENIYNDINGRLKAKRDELCHVLSYIKSSLRSRFVYELGSHTQGTPGTTPHTPIILNPIGPIVVTIKYDPKLDASESGGTDAAYLHRFSPFVDFRDFFNVILEQYVLPKTTWTVESITFDGVTLSELLARCRGQVYSPILKIIPSGCTVLISPASAHKDDLRLSAQLEAKLKSERKRYPGYIRTIPTCSWSGPGSWEMGIGVQGNIRQGIEETYHPNLWRWDRSRFINIQIINAVVFHKITGLSYAGPMPLKLSYQSFKAKVTSTTTQQKSSGSPYKTISEIDSEKGIALSIDLQEGGKRIGCACCEKNFCDTVIKPCNHVFCGECIEGAMQTIAGGLTCDFCEIAAESTVRFAAAMELPTGHYFDPPEEFGEVSNILSKKSTEVAIARSTPTSSSGELTHEDVLPVYQMLAPFLAGKSPQDFATPGHYIYWAACRPDILDALITKLLGLTLRKRVSLLYQILKVGPSFHPQDIWERRKLEFEVHQNSTRAFLRLVPEASDMIHDGEPPSTLGDALRPCEGNSRWLYLYFEDIFQWVGKSSLSFDDIGVPICEFLRIGMTESSIDLIINYIASQNTAATALNSYLLSLRGTENVDYALKKLVSMGADINAQDDDGNTVFHLCNFGDTSDNYWGQGISKKLLALGARVDIPNNNMDTALHLAAMRDCVSDLPELCADKSAKNVINLRNKEGYTPYHLCLATTTISSLITDLKWSRESDNTTIKTFTSAEADFTISLPEGDTWVKKTIKERVWRSGLHPSLWTGWIDKQIVTEYDGYYNNELSLMDEKTQRKLTGPMMYAYYSRSYMCGL